MPGVLQLVASGGACHLQQWDGQVRPDTTIVLSIQPVQCERLAHTAWNGCLMPTATRGLQGSK
jgi:hypothetical protein